MAVALQPRYTSEQYLAIERAADHKSEYLDGHIYAMAGSTPEHSAITANATFALAAQLLDMPCQVYSNDMKVRTSPDGLFAYPDLSVVCGDPVFHDETRDVLINPVIIVEVLSDSTEAYDRGKKFIRYRQMESLRDYLLIAQHEPYVEHYARKVDGTWLLTPADGLESEVQLTAVDRAIALSTIYRNIRFPPVETSGAPSD